MKQTKMRLGVASAIFLTFAMAGVVLTAAPAGANSRGYTVKNLTVHNLTLESVKPFNGNFYEEALYSRDYPAGIRAYPKGSNRMEFEGRPADGSVIPPGRSIRFELKYAFGNTFAAQITYKVGTTGYVVVFNIVTDSSSNDSQCLVCPHPLGVCSAKGVDLEYNGGDPFYVKDGIRHTKFREPAGIGCVWYPER